MITLWVVEYWEDDAWAPTGVVYFTRAAAREWIALRRSRSVLGYRYRVARYARVTR